MTKEFVPVREARARLADVIARATQGRTTVITRHNRPVAAVVPTELPIEHQQLQVEKIDWLLREGRHESTHSLSEVKLAIHDRRRNRRHERELNEHLQEREDR
ncbi:prevent-host-death family protein [Kitasatospora sp. MAA4]|uniref:type II toxin-antitoxin system Phd/YefM family antitoxin n=1 Tax=Kitasatospora sp. MAA4 TaxID=3035093 RepID=UPI0024730F64|nr:type II toxin-antitoxin system prevent-host-death family antitoxin [Kitasatospora sp. MAA4]MDH6133423.1 prevent-host-death family protein [Kitasatospora sp. MAA4]